MKPALIDTNILSFFFRNYSLVVERFQAYLKEHDKINISIITYYEIVSGLKHRDAQKQLISFLEFGFIQYGFTSNYKLCHNFC
jgi:tRNA(fMet)-specific endonuclease VapC